MSSLAGLAGGSLTLMTSRFASSLILMGLIGLVVFITTFLGGKMEVLILLLGASLTALGLILRQRGRRQNQDD